MAASTRDAEQSGQSNLEELSTEQSRQPSAASTDSASADASSLQQPVVERPGHVANDPRHRGSPLFHSPTPIGTPVEAVPSSTPPSMRFVQRVRHVWLMSKGMFMVMLAQFFGASMNTMTRTLQLDGPHGKGMNPFQVLFVRMFATVVCSALYMWYAKVPHPLGVREVRPLLFLRGVSGFLGVFGLYYSLVYLPLSEATVLTFLAPILSCYACSLVIPGEVFTKKQQLAGFASLIGVVLIARPMSLLSDGSAAVSPEAVVPVNATDSSLLLNSSASATTTLDLFITTTTTTTSTTAAATDSTPNDVTPQERFVAILAALMGVMGATLAYTSIRKIGQRAHPLVSVTYFSTLTTLISLAAVLVLPSVSFRLPSNWTEFLLLLGLGTCGFLLQFLLTAGLAYVPPPSTTVGVSASTGTGTSNGPGPGVVGPTEKPKTSSHGSRATSMVYTQMIFALFYDKVVWDSTPSPMSWAGSAIILCSALYVALAKDEGGKSKTKTATTKKMMKKKILRRGGADDRQGPGAGEDADVDHDDDLDLDLERGRGGRSGLGPRWGGPWNWRRGRRDRFDGEEGHEHERTGLLDEHDREQEEDEHHHDLR
ncbi:hypothetical protein VTO42DRAFT_6455 [Malbranchea cinnamomea]